MKKLMLMASMAIFCLGLAAQTPVKKTETKTEKKECCKKAKACSDCKDATCKEAKCKDCKCSGCCEKKSETTTEKEECCKSKSKK